MAPFRIPIIHSHLGSSWTIFRLHDSSEYARTKLMEDQTDAGSTFVLQQVAHV